MTPNNPEPAPVLPAWWDVVRQLNACSHAGACGTRLITISILTDRDGVPVVWTEPKVTRIQPGRAAVSNFLDVLEKDAVSTRYDKKES